MSVVMRWLSVRGADSEVFLQGQLSCDVASLDREHWQLGAYCSPQGKVLAVIWLFRDELGFNLGMPSEVIEGVQKRLRLFVLRSRVDITISNFVGMPFRSLLCSESSRRLSINEQCIYQLHGSSLISVGLLEQQPIESRLDSSAWRATRIRAGIAQIYPQTADQFLPQALGLDYAGAISFTKGCYVGQENIARLHYKSQTRRHLAIAERAAPIKLSAGDALYHAGQRGAIILDSGSDELGYVVQAVVPERLLGMPLQIDGSDEVLYFKRCYESE